MSQKPIVMEQLKQILQLKQDGISIRETARRTGLSRNSVKKYLSLLKADSSTEQLSDKALADKAYSSDEYLTQWNSLLHSSCFLEKKTN